ncbi:SpaA isopeptide-forming pilin-related protein [Jeotgalibacillus haloalkalitolerans]|uniref:SpaA isopeptide-forming pilin-related protein n=1 Tax=Jeotgalibacillus haloalkalitolerans TaxID=3104292 RepID=A0ABU5KJP1_9BACL|nr:SpaA isopeptide-forming pilin-related protein [Jeotgalibacillus sp. HH7-29]MDZ5711359.1 SpaA isopeptide-forming pilin-related protein [Jeotgalibacillus sp. HH7-29]
MRTIKRISLLVLGFVLILSQNAPYVFANEDPIEPEVILTAESIEGNTVTLQLTSTGNAEEFIVEFPDGATFDQEVTRSLNHVEASMQYDNENSTLTVVKEGGNFLFVAGNLPEGSNTFYVTAYHGGQEVAANEMIVTVTATVTPEDNTDINPENQEVTNNEETRQEDIVNMDDEIKESDQQNDSIISSEEGITNDEQISENEITDTQDTQESKPDENNDDDLILQSDDAELQSQAYIVPDGNLELYFNALEQEVVSGRTSNYQLDLKATGSQTRYENAELVVELPQSDEVNMIYPQIINGVPDDSLRIANVLPLYDEITQTLTYVIPELETGQSYRINIKATPELGTTPVSNLTTNQRIMTAQAQFTSLSTEETITATPDDIYIISDASVNINKVYQGAERTISGEKQEILGAPIANDYLKWELRVNVPKQNFGQSFLREGSKIIVRDLVPQELEFFPEDQTPGFMGVYDSTDRTITWEFDAPTFEQQALSTNSLFSENLNVTLRINSATPDYSFLTNQANVIIDVHKGENESLITRTDNASSTVEMGGVGINPGIVEGELYYGFHLGPSNGSGGSQDLSNAGDIPVVTDDASLTFLNWIHLSNNNLEYSYNGGPWTSGGQNLPLQNQILASGYQQYTMEYTIDSKLKLNRLGVFMPVDEWNVNSPLRYYSVTPATYIQFKVNGVWRAEYQFDFLPGQDFRLLNVIDYGVAENEHVEAYRYIVRDAPGTMSTGIFSYYDVYDGAVGLATNTVTYNYELNDGTRVWLRPWSDNHPDGPSSHGQRSVNIVGFMDTEPTVRTSINFVDGSDTVLNVDSNIQRGNNRIQVEFENTASSPDNVTGPVELVALLPPGVKLADLLNLTYTGSSSPPSYEVIGEVNGQLQVKFNFDVNRLLPGERITASFDVDVTRTAPSTLEMQVYGFSSNSNLQVPSNQGDTVARSVLELDANDLNGNDIFSDFRVKSENRYTILKSDNLLITKEVKGELDSEYSLFGYTTPDGDVNYRFNLTNTTGEVIEKFSFLDVLPSVGDLGITDNVPRGSQFEVLLKGPISFTDTLWEDQVTVLYSTAKNPSRSDLYSTVDFPNGASLPTDPAGAEIPDWLTETEVIDWSAIHSFKIVMNDGVEWLEGQNIVFEIEAIAPALPVDRSLLDPEAALEDRAAWNSFAVTTNGLLAVEPLRVGVVMEYDIEDPVVEKTVDGQTETLDLANRDQVFTWEVDYSFGNFIDGWDSVVLRDEVHELLEILAVRILDEAGNDISDTGTLTVTDNLVTFVPDKVDDSYSYLSGSVYTLEIDTSIRADVTNEELLPFIQGNGIPNQAELIIDDDPTLSNEVNVKPPGYAGLDVTKVDEETGEVLAGATFELRACASADTPAGDCTLVETLTTDASGIISFRDLPLGEYVLIETEAPDGYRLLTAPVRITLADADAGEIVERTVENSKNGWELPATGGIGALIYTLIGLILMAITAFALFRRKEQPVVQ